MNASNIASRDFSRTTLAALRRSGISVISATFVPGVDGSFANGERAYVLNDNGTAKVRTFLQVLRLAE